MKSSKDLDKRIRTMSKDSTELFELCKEVYRRTKWDDTDSQTDGVGVINSKLKYLGAVPLYTSDYLLEKLPKEIDEHFLRVEICNAHKHLEWMADYYNHRYSTYLISGEPNKADTIHGSTPLKALLKLVIALDGSGVKL